MRDKAPLRRLGIKIFSILFLLFGGSGLNALVRAVYGSLRFKTILFFPALRHNLSTWVVPFLASLFIVCAAGIFQLKKWARYTVITLCWILILLYNIILIDTIFSEFETIFRMIILAESLIIIFVIVFLLYAIYYFTLPDIKKEFN